ncbi:MAG: MotA/TolQ/ExbB proton channel family protein [Leptolyngbyaceae cyanobacterium RU_5_1]|nr:MotA/TolQ/ExbB proton channel family protein [Leptolyngbyaceae cyanobacterium RU_5_1]
MARLFDVLVKGGPVMIPIVGLSVVTLACAMERGVFWYQLLRRENRVVHDVLEAARYDLREAAAIAENAQDLAIGRFLLAPLRLTSPTPETFHLAMESVADQEFATMRKGDRLLESVVGLAPLLGLLGTVIGLITTFGNLNIGAGKAADTSKAAAGIGEALTATAGGMLVAIVALAVFRILVSLQAQQVDYFSKVGSELELIYRQVWYEPSLRQTETFSREE